MGSSTCYLLTRICLCFCELASKRFLPEALGLKAFLALCISMPFTLFACCWAFISSVGAAVDSRRLQLPTAQQENCEVLAVSTAHFSRPYAVLTLQARAHHKPSESLDDLEPSWKHNGSRSFRSMQTATARKRSQFCGASAQQLLQRFPQAAKPLAAGERPWIARLLLLLARMSSKVTTAITGTDDPGACSRRFDVVQRSFS